MMTIIFVMSTDTKTQKIRQIGIKIFFTLKYKCHPAQGKVKLTHS